MKATTKTRAKAKSLTRVGDPECHVARRTSHGEKLVGQGAAAIQTVRETRPDVYVKVVASLLPRQVQAEVSGLAHPLATAIDGGDIVDPVLGRYGVSALIKQKPKAVVDGLIVAIGVDDVIDESGLIAAGYPDEIPLKPLE